jgi:hypothetical protein
MTSASGAQGTGRERGVHEEGQCEGGRASEWRGKRGGTAEGGSDVTRTHARWLSGDKHIGDKGGRQCAPEVKWDGTRTLVLKGAKME